MSFCLKVLLAPPDSERVGVKFDLEEGETPLGRISPPSKIVLKSPKVSKLHCIFKNQGGKLEVADQGSSNGIYVNGKKVIQSALKEKDRLVIGEYTLEVTVK